MKMLDKYISASKPIITDFMSEWKPKKEYQWIERNFGHNPLGMLKLSLASIFVTLCAWFATQNPVLTIASGFCFAFVVNVLSQIHLEVDNEGLTREQFAAKKWKEKFQDAGLIYTGSNIRIPTPFACKAGFGQIFYGDTLAGGWRYVRDEEVVFDSEMIREVHSVDRATFQLILCGQVFLEATLLTKGNVDHETMTLISIAGNEAISLLQHAEGFGEIVSEDTATAVAIKDLLAKLAPAIMYVCEGEIPVNPADEAAFLKWLISKERTTGTPYEVTYQTGWNNSDIPTVTAAT